MKKLQIFYPNIKQAGLKKACIFLQALLDSTIYYAIIG